MAASVAHTRSLPLRGPAAALGRAAEGKPCLLALDIAGKAAIQGTPREVVALHKERYVFPVSLLVAKVSGSGADAVYMGILKVRQHPVQCSPRIM